MSSVSRSEPEAAGAIRAKESIRDLAVAGGPPAFPEQVYVGRPNLGVRERLIERIHAILDRGWLSNSGPCVTELSDRLEELTGAKNVLPMVNGTVALEIAIRAAGLTGEVIVPSFTFIATAHALQWQRVTPVFCDIDPATHNIDPDRVEELITPNTTGIIGVHLWGRPCAVDRLAEIADRHGLKLLFDAAHAFNVSLGGKKIGTFGDAEVFSFHATKFINSLEGGAVVTNGDDLAMKIRLMKNFGFTGYDRVEHIGTNGKMNEFSAAMGLTALESMDEYIALNRANYERYRRALDGVPGIEILTYDGVEDPNYQYVVVEVDADRIGFTRDEIVAILHTENILARRYFYPGCHRMEPYRSYFPNAGLLLPETERIAEKIVCLPTGTGISPEGIDCISGILSMVVSEGDALRRLGPQIPGFRLARFGETGV